MLENAVYRGRVTHTRREPRVNHFDYGVSMYMVDVDQPQSLTALSPFMSVNKWNLVTYDARDYFKRSGDVSQGIKERIYEETGETFSGQILLLTQLKRIGFVFNPVSFYFCVDESKSLAFIVSEIENTPWGERYSYVHKMEASSPTTVKFEKSFHVSPFLPMNMDYSWRFLVKEDAIHIQMRCHQEGHLKLHTNLTLQKQITNGSSLSRLAFTGIFHTLKIPVLIYLQAWKLWWKKTPFFEHPNPASRKGI